MKFFDLATLSMTPTSGIAETKIPLWWADGTSVSCNTTANYYLQDGSTTLGEGSPPGANGRLFALSSNWPPNIQYALEVTTWTSSSSYGNHINLWNATTNTQLYSAGIYTTVTSPTVIRSSNFTLTPGDQYAINFYQSGGTGYISDASLIIFPQ